MVRLQGYTVFNRSGKSAGWHTALYYFAEYISAITDGEVNYKILYAHLGMLGRYINHDNPRIRKSTASMLSRIVHSARYVADFKERYTFDHLVFQEAANWLYEECLNKSDLTPEELLDATVSLIWPGVRAGLINEFDSGREFNLVRACSEMEIFIKGVVAAPLEANERFGVLVSSMLELMTRGHLDSDIMYGFVEEASFFVPDESDMCAHPYASCAALFAMCDASSCALGGVWMLSGSEVFTIGRYFDCDAIDAHDNVSREHCTISVCDGRWVLKDLHSTNGTVVKNKDGAVMYDSMAPGAASTYELQFGQHIVLADCSHYWFMGLEDTHEDIPRNCHTFNKGLAL